MHTTFFYSKNNTQLSCFLRICAIAILFLFSTNLYAQRKQSESELANQYASTGECDKAIVYFEKYFDEDPLGAYPGYIKCLMQLKEYAKAEKIIKKQTKRFSTEPAYKLDLANLYEVQRETEKSKKIVSDLIKNIIPDVNAVNLLGNTFMQRQQYENAANTYLQGRKVLRGAYPFSFELAEVYAQQNKMPEMIEEYMNLVEYNPGYIANVQTILQNKIGNDLTGSLSDLLRTALLRKIQKNTQTTEFSELLYWLFLQEKDFDSALIQAKALDKRLNENGQRTLSLGRLCVSNMDYSTAEKCFQYIVDKGASNPNYVTAKMELINAVNLKITTSNTYTAADLSKLDHDYQTAINELGKNANTAPLIRGYAHLKAFYIHQTDSAIALLQETINLPNISAPFRADCKLELADIDVFIGDVWEAALLYGQVDKEFKNDVLGREAKFRNARLSYYLGEFEWAKDQLGVLKSATSQLISNDALSLGLLISDNTNMDDDTTYTAMLMYSRGDLLAYQNKDSLSLITLDSILSKFPNHTLTDEVWFKKAQISTKQGKFEAAIPFLQDVIEKYPTDILADDALFQLADIYQNKLNNKDKAKELYESLLTKYPGSLFAVDARKRFRTLRGDKVN